MNTRQYTKSERKAVKRAMRTSTYVNQQNQAKRGRRELETIISIRNTRIEKLEEMLKSVATRNAEGVLFNATLTDEVKAEITKLQTS